MIVAGLPYAGKIADDTLIWADSEDKLEGRVRTVLQRCKEEGITSSMKKFEIGSKLKFVGHIVSNEGIHPDPEQLDTIRHFPKPKNHKDIRRFLGMANQLGSFVPDLSHMSKHVRKLLKKNTAFNWLEDHKKEFTRMKNLLTGDRVVKPFDPKKHSTLVTDASRLLGIGYALMPKKLDGKLK